MPELVTNGSGLVGLTSAHYTTVYVLVFCAGTSRYTTDGKSVEPHSILWRTRLDSGSYPFLGLWMARLGSRSLPTFPFLFSCFSLFFFLRSLYR